MSKVKPIEEWRSFVELEDVANIDKVRSLETLTNELAEAIESALRIEDLWIYETVEIEHEEEAKALHMMRAQFLESMQKIKAYNEEIDK